MSKYLRNFFCLAIFTLTTCVGCNKNSASATNFEAGLNHYFQNNPECYNQTFPFTTLEDPQDDELVKIGVLTKRAGSPIDITLSYTIYDLSETGRHSVSPSDSSKLCFGAKKVERIVNFSKSGSEGDQESSVTYVWALTNVPDWAKLAFSTQPFSGWGVANEVKGTLSEKDRTATDTMRLTNLGWRRSDDTGQ
jgi:hypothetical protein